MKITKRPDVLIALGELDGVTEYTGGVGRRYASTVPHLASTGLKITTLLLPDSRPVRQIGETPGLIVLDLVRWLPWRVRTLFRPFLVLLAVIALRPRLVYCPEWLGMASFLPKRYPVVTNLVTGLELVRFSAVSGESRAHPQSAVTRIIDKAQIWLERRQVGRSVRVVACSTATLRWYETQGYRLPAVQERLIVRNCIDVKAVRSAIEGTSRKRDEQSRKRVTFVGRVERRKGIDVAVEAFGLVADRVDTVDFFVIGSESDSATEPQWVDLLHSLKNEHRDRVSYLGHLAAPEIYRQIARSDVVVCPSRWEAFGNVALEVKACGVPLIATTGSGFDDFCANGIDSVLVEPGSPNELAESIEAVIKDPTFSMSIVARASRSVEEFSAESVAHDLAPALQWTRDVRRFGDWWNR